MSEYRFIVRVKPKKSQSENDTYNNEVEDFIKEEYRKMVLDWEETETGVDELGASITSITRSGEVTVQFNKKLYNPPYFSFINP